MQDMNRDIRSLKLDCAGWSVPASQAYAFPVEGSHLYRYAQRFSAIEINSSFYRSHRPATYARWAGSVPSHFQFAVKMPKEITHRRRLIDVAEPLGHLLAEVQALGPKLGPLLIQLPPSLSFHEKMAEAFFTVLRERFNGTAVANHAIAAGSLPKPGNCCMRRKLLVSPSIRH